jgi:septal ring factor EnvC (AmiA/AmiB activator)
MMMITSSFNQHQQTCFNNNNNGLSSQSLLQQTSTNYCNNNNTSLFMTHPVYQKMNKEIKRLKNRVKTLERQVTEANEKANQYRMQSTLTSFGIKILKNAQGGISPKLLKCISQQVADTFLTPIILKKNAKSPTRSRKKVLINSVPSPQISKSEFVFHKILFEK